MKSSVLAALTATAVAVAGCQKTAAPAAGSVAVASISEAAAAKIADATVVSWTSTDPAKIKALYAPSIVGFDYASDSWPIVNEHCSAVPETG